jgi:hypothetical protein
MRLLVRLAPLLLTVPVCLPLAAQDSTSTFPNVMSRRARFQISGTVRDAASNRAMDGTKVDLRAIGGQTLATAVTSLSGGFVFNNVRADDYVLAVEETGYESVNQQVTVENSIFGLELSLRRPDAPAGSPVPTVSTRELSVPRKAHDYMQKGMGLLYDKADARGSVEQFQRAIKEYPDYYEAYAQMGTAYTSLGDAANAEQALRKAIDVSNQHYADAYLMLASLYSSGKRFADAEAAARKGSDLDANSWQGQYEMARALYGLNRDAEAEPHVVAAEQLQPDRAEIRLLGTNIHVRLRKYPLVLEDVNAYLGLDPNGPTSDRMRQLRDQVQQALEKAQAPAARAPAGDESQSTAGRQEPNSK